MKTGIIGPGALGCLFASKLFLAAAPQDTILLIDHNPERATILNERGILYEEESRQRQLPIPISSNPGKTGPLQFLFCCVKSHDLATTLEFARPLLCPSTLVIFLQNGIAHLHYTSEQLHAIPVFGSSTEGATRLGPGHTRHGGNGQTALGFLDPQGKVAHASLTTIQDTLNKAGLPTTIETDIGASLWAKLFINVGINGLTAIHDCSNGQLIDSPLILAKLKELVGEAMGVARAHGITILGDPLAETIAVCKRTATNISSMLQDVRNGRHTEIDAINGAISRLGQSHCIATPHNDALIAQIKALPRT